MEKIDKRKILQSILEELKGDVGVWEVIWPTLRDPATVEEECLFQDSAGRRVRFMIRNSWFREHSADDIKRLLRVKLKENT